MNMKHTHAHLLPWLFFWAWSIVYQSDMLTFTLITTEGISQKKVKEINNSKNLTTSVRMTTLISTNHLKKDNSRGYLRTQQLTC